MPTFSRLLHLFFLWATLATSLFSAEKPNVLFIAVDDLNHWLTHLERHPQAKTPNFDRLAAMGMTFRNAYCAVPACEPSRCAIMGGRRATTSGCYKNGDTWKRYQADGEGLSAQFLKAGYFVAGAGKIYHNHQHYPSEWTDYMDGEGLSGSGAGVDKFDGYFNQKEHPNLKDEDIVDWHSASYIIERLGQKREKPFFLACGLYKPHLPFVAPRKYYEDYPLDEIELPPYREDDLKDLPEAALKMLGSDHAKMLAGNQWKVAIQSYLATVAYTDMNLGRLLDAYEAIPEKENTIIVLWSDHGWSLGEKHRWRKFALWEEPTQTPYQWVVPGVTKPGSVCDRPVDLHSIYPTLCALTGLKKPDHVEGHDISSLLRDPKAEWEHHAWTTHGRGNHGIRTQTHRYIRYANGDEELYDHSKDPYEWTNLAPNPETAPLRQKLRALLPAQASEARAKPKTPKKK